MRHSFFLLALLLTACAPATGGAVSLDGTRWTLSEISGSPAAPGASVTLELADGQATGSGGCNQYRAPYTASGTTLAFGPAVSTKRACTEQALNAQETAYFDALGRVASYTVSNDRLVLRDAAGTTLLTFVR